MTIMVGSNAVAGRQGAQAATESLHPDPQAQGRKGE